MFFDQIKEIEVAINQLKDDLINIGQGVDDHFNQLDDIAAHVIALEAIIKKTEVDAEAIKAWIVDATETSIGKEGGSEKAKIIVENLLAGNPLPKREGSG